MKPYGKRLTLSCPEPALVLYQSATPAARTGSYRCDTGLNTTSTPTPGRPSGVLAVVTAVAVTRVSASSWQLVSSVLAKREPAHMPAARWEVDR